MSDLASVRTRGFPLVNTNKEKFVMYLRKIFTAAALSVATLVPTLAHAANAGQPPCILSEHHIVSVAPYQVDRSYGKVHLSAVARR
jgi:hypothetical protein